MANLKLTDEVLNSERMVVFEERRLRTDNTPEGKMEESLWQLAFRRHPYQWPVIGYPQDLLSITTDQLVEYYKSHYQPANAALVIVGDFKPDTTMAMIHRYYDSVPGAPKPPRNIQDEPEQEEERRLTLHDHVASERFAQAYHVTSASNDDSYALDVLANILFQGTSSRAYRALVDEKELATDISGSAFTPTYPGLFIITGSTKMGAKSSKVEDELYGLIRDVQDHGVSQDEINAAVKQLTVELVDSVRTPQGLGNLIGTVQTIFGDPERFSDDLSKYQKVTDRDVRRVALKYLIPNNRSVVVVVPETPSGSAKKTEGGHS